MDAIETDLVSIVVRCSNFNCCRQIEDDGVFLAAIGALVPRILDGVADLDGKVWLGLGESFRRVFELPFCPVTAGSGFIHELSDQFGPGDCEFNGLLLGVSEDGVAEERRSSVVEMEDDLGGVAN